jgi:H+-transporting ATPase
VEQIDFLPFDPIVKRTEGTLRNKKTGKVFRTSKGAPHVILKLTSDAKVHHHCEQDVTALGSRGIRALAVAIENDGVWKMVRLMMKLVNFLRESKWNVFVLLVGTADVLGPSSS